MSSPVVDNKVIQSQLDDVRRFCYKSETKSFLDLSFISKNLTDKTFSQLIGFKKKAIDFKDEIVIATDGSVANFLAKKHSTKGTTLGFGIYFQNFYKTTRTFGSINNMNFKNISSHEIELFALHKSLQVLKKEYGYVDLKERNINLFSDSANVLASLYPYLLIELENPIYAQKRENFFFKPSDFFIKSAEIKISHQQHNCETSHQLLKEIAEFVVENEINLTWIRGHRYFYQNEIADTLSSIAKTQASLDNNVKALRIPDTTTICTSTQVAWKRLDKRDLFVHRRKIFRTGQYENIFSKHLHFNIFDHKKTSELYSVDSNDNIRVNYHLNINTNYDLGKKNIYNDVTLIRNSKINKKSLSSKEYQNFGDNLKKSMQTDLNNLSTFILKNTLNDIAVQAKQENRQIEELVIRFSHSTTLEHFQENFFKHLDKNISLCLPPLSTFKQTKFIYNMPFLNPKNKESITQVHLPLIQKGKVYSLSNSPEVEKVKATSLLSPNLKENYIQSLIKTGLINESPNLNEKATNLFKYQLKKLPKIYSFAFSHFEEEMEEKRRMATVTNPNIKRKKNSTAEKNSFSPN